MKLLIIISFILGSTTFAQYSNESELATISNGGNTEQETWNAKMMNTYVIDKNAFKLGGHYSYGKSEQELNARNSDVNTRYERILSKKWSTFTGVQREDDFFANVEYRWNYDLGASYNFLETDKNKLHSEFGYRRTLESDFEGRKVNGTKIRLYSEYSRQHNESLFFRLWVEVVPNISESNDWQTNFEPSANINLSKILTLKVGYLHKYDNQPAFDRKKNDYQYTTSLIARF